VTDDDRLDRLGQGLGSGAGRPSGQVQLLDRQPEEEVSVFRGSATEQLDRLRWRQVAGELLSLEDRTSR